MKKLRFFAAAVVAALLLSSVPLAAHHKFESEYDSAKPLTLRGKASHLDWLNPHALLYVDVVGADGKTTSWRGELLSPNALFGRGWSKSSISPGDEVVVNGFGSKNGSAQIWVNDVSLVTSGRRLGMGPLPNSVRSATAEQK